MYIYIHTPHTKLWIYGNNELEIEKALYMELRTWERQSRKLSFKKLTPPFHLTTCNVKVPDRLHGETTYSHLTSKRRDIFQYFPENIFFLKMRKKNYNKSLFSLNMLGCPAPAIWAGACWCTWIYGGQNKIGVQVSVETFCHVHDGGYAHAGKRKWMFTNLIKRYDT